MNGDWAARKIKDTSKVKVKKMSWQLVLESGLKRMSGIRVFKGRQVHYLIKLFLASTGGKSASTLGYTFGAIV